MKELSIIIVNWNTADLTVDCLRSLYSNCDNSLIDVWLVDNNSSDDSVARIKAEFGDKVHLIENKENLGFAKANNQALRLVKTPYVALLNSDTIVEKNAFENMIEYLKNNSDVGAIGPQLPMPNGTLKILSCGYLPSIRSVVNHSYGLLRFPILNRFIKRGLFLPYYNFKEPLDVEWLSGACIVTKKEVLETAGLLPEDYFMYAEDMQWCENILKAGWKVQYFPHSVIWHLMGASNKEKKVSTNWLINLRLYYNTRTDKKVNKVLFSFILFSGYFIRYVSTKGIALILKKEWAKVKSVQFKAYMNASLKHLD
ncbi:glycosyltransferase family 2 protein [Neobacillus drentensis]|uniref:glycosyltransferase family 2 protein n=1 Tax=Neobacillus drentensis TaxID=220684 RepID=UPI002FFDE181